MASFVLSTTFSDSSASGCFSLQMVDNLTESGTLTGLATVSGQDTFGVAGTFTSAATPSSSASFSRTATETTIENESGTFGLTIVGSISGGGTNLCISSVALFSLSESLAGTFSKQHTGGVNQSSLATSANQPDATDDFIINYGGVVTTTGVSGDTNGDTNVNSSILTATDCFSQSGSVNYTFTEIGSATSSYSLSSYVYNATLSNGVQTGQSTSTTTIFGTGTASNTGSDVGSNLSSFGGLSGTVNPYGAATFGGTISSTQTITQFLTETIALSQVTYQAGTYGGGSYALSSVNYTNSSQDTWSMSGTNLQTQSGTDTTSSLGTAYDNGTAVHGGETGTAVATPTGDSANTTTFNGCFQQTTNQAGFTSMTLNKQGTYSEFSYNFSNVTYQLSQNYGQTVSSSATSIYSGTGTQGSIDSANSGNTGSFPIGTDSGLVTGSQSSQQTFTQAGTLTSNQTTVTSDSWSLYEKGSFSNAGNPSVWSWSLSSVNYQESYTSTYALKNTNVSLQTGTDSYSSAGTTSADNAASYGGGSSNGSSTVFQSTSGQDSFNASLNSTTTQSGGNTFSWSRLGIFGSESFAFSSLIYQGGQTVSNTWTGSNLQTSTGNGISTTISSDQPKTAGTYVQGQETSAVSMTQTATQSFTGNGTVTLSQTKTLTETTTFYEEGTWSGQSYNLSCVVLTDNRLNTSSADQSNLQTRNGPETRITTSTGNGSATMFTSGGSVSGPSTVNSTETFTGSMISTTLDSASGSSSDSWSESKQGTYSNFSFAFSSYVSQDLATVNQSSLHSGNDSQTGTVVSSASATDSTGDSSVVGDYVNLGLGSSTLSSANSFNQTRQDTVTNSLTSLETSSAYQAGRYSFNSYSFTSVLKSDQTAQTVSNFSSDSNTNISQQTLSLSGTIVLTGTLALWAGSQGSGQTVDATQTFITSDTQTSGDTANSSSTDNRSITEQGIYGNWSYSFGTVVKTENATGSATRQSSQHDTFTGSDVGTWTSINSTSDGATLVMDSAAAQDSATKSGGFTVNDQRYSGSSSTDTSQTSATGYRLGSFAGASYAFSSVNDFSSAADTRASNSSASANGTVQFTSADLETATLRQAALYGPGGLADPGTSQNNANASLTETFTTTQAANQTSTSSFTKTALGCFSNLSYSFSSFVHQRGDTLTQTSQQTTSRSLSESMSGTGTGTAAPLFTTGLTAGTFPAGNNSVSENAVIQDSFSLSLLETITNSAASTFNDSVYQDGTFSNGSYGFGSVLYGESSTNSSTKQDLTSSTQTDNATVNDTSTEGQTGGDGGDGFNLQAYSSFTRGGTLTQNSTVSDSSLASHSLYQAGSFSNNSFGLSSFNLVDQGAETHVTNSLATSSGLQTGSNSAVDTADGSAVVNSSDTYVQSSSGTSSAQHTGTSGFTLSEQGSFGRGSYALSSFLLAENQGAADSSSSAGSGVQTFSGTNLGQPYSGSAALASTIAAQDSWGGSLTEQGIYNGGSFSLSTATYAGSGTESSMQSNSANAGSTADSLSLGGNSSYNVSAVGNFAGGSWSLSTYLLTGGSNGSFSRAETGSGFARTDSFQQGQTIYQAGTMSAGVYANTSYVLSEQGAETVVNQYNSSSLDTTLTTFSALQTLSGPQSQSGSNSFSWQEGGGLVTTVSGGWSTTMTVALPGTAAVLPTPDTGLIPVAGADGPTPMALITSGPPVPAGYNGQALADHNSWLFNQSAAVWPTVRHAEDVARVRAGAAPTVIPGVVGNSFMIVAGPGSTGGAAGTGSAGSSGSGSTSGSSPSSASSSSPSGSSGTSAAGLGAGSVLPTSGMWISSGSLDIRLAGQSAPAAGGGASSSSSPSASGSSSGSGGGTSTGSGSSTGAGSGTSPAASAAGIAAPSGRSAAGPGSAGGGSVPSSGSAGPGSNNAVRQGGGIYLPGPVLDIRAQGSGVSPSDGNGQPTGASLGAPNAGPQTQSVSLAGGGSVAQASNFVASTSVNGSTETVSASITVNLAGTEPYTVGSGTNSLSGSVNYNLQETLSTQNGETSIGSFTFTCSGAFVEDGQVSSFAIEIEGPADEPVINVSQTNTTLLANLAVSLPADGESLPASTWVASAVSWFADFAAHVDNAVEQELVMASGGPHNVKVAAVPYGPSVAGTTEDETLNSAGDVLSDTVTNNVTGQVEYHDTATYDSAGDKLTETDGAGRTTDWTYDKQGELTSETIAAGTPQAATTKYVYQNGNLVEVIDPDNNDTEYGYNAQGQQISMTDSLGHTQYMTYNQEGFLASVTNRNGLTRTLGYNQAGQLTSETWYAADGKTVVNQLTFTYNAQGQLLTAGNNVGTYTFSYDDQGRVIGVQEPFGVSLKFAYDANGNRVLVQDSFGGTTKSVYDAANQLVNEIFSQTGQATLGIEQSYNSAGEVVNRTYSTSAVGRIANPSTVVTSAYTFDLSGNTTTIIHKNATGKVLAQFDYTYDEAGDLVSETDNGVATNYQYDQTGQLVGYANKTQTYDPNGNRTNPGYVTGPDNQLLSDGTWNYGYDQEGNLVSKTNIKTGEKWTYGYDNINELISAVLTTAKGQIESASYYKYDVFGNRVETDVFTRGKGTAVTRFVYDAWNPNVPSGTGNENWSVWATLNVHNQLTTRYVHGDALDQIFAQVSSHGQVGWYLTDQLGSTRLLVSISGAVLDKINYDAFGNITSQSSAANEPLFLYTGQQWDRATGLQYSRARYYDPGTGRWMSEDPSAFGAGGSNLYRYVSNKPNNEVDPGGEQAAAVGAMRPNAELYTNLMQRMRQAVAGGNQATRTRLQQMLGLFPRTTWSYGPTAQWARDAIHLLDQINPATGRHWTMAEISGALGPMPVPPSSGERRPRDLENTAYASMLDFPRQYDETVTGRGAAAAALLLITRSLPMTIGETTLEVAWNFFPGRVISFAAKAVGKGFRFTKAGGRWVVQKLVGGKLKDLTAAEAQQFIREFIPWASGSPLGETVSGQLRREARLIWEARAGTRAIANGWRVHHRIPLRYAHYFRNSNPNRVSNLIGMAEADHIAIERAWTTWETALGRVPTAEEVMRQALRLDEQFANAMHFLP